MDGVKRGGYGEQPAVAVDNRSSLRLYAFLAVAWREIFKCLLVRFPDGLQIYYLSDDHQRCDEKETIDGPQDLADPVSVFR